MTESMICEPPKPRLMTRWSGKSEASVFHKRMLELPTNRMAPRGGGFVASVAVKALISFANGCDNGKGSKRGGFVAQLERLKIRARAANTRMLVSELFGRMDCMASVMNSCALRFKHGP